jgi:hypothetical protein
MTPSQNLVNEIHNNIVAIINILGTMHQTKLEPKHVAKTFFQNFCNFKSLIKMVRLDLMPKYNVAIQDIELLKHEWTHWNKCSIKTSKDESDQEVHYL